MIQYLVTVMIFVFLTIFFKLYHQPKKVLQAYKAKLQSLGYRVKLYPFEFLRHPVFTQYMKQEKQHGDGLYKFKNEYQKYDIILYNIIDNPTVEFENQDLIRMFLQPDNVYIHLKLPFMLKNLQRSIGKGTAFSEGKQWKRKRGIMNSVFNYEFIINNIAKVTKICSENLDLMEQECKHNGKLQQKDGKKIYKVKIFQLVSNMFANVMLQCFFGTNSTHQKINGQPIITFINRLNADIHLQTFQLPVLIFGPKFVQLGLRKKDRDIKRRIKILKELAAKFIKIRLAQLEQNGSKQKNQDIIQALVLKQRLEMSQSKTPRSQQERQQADKYDFEELIEQFSTFFAAGTDTTSNFTQMMIYLISQRKDVEQKLRKQINDVIKTDEDITKQNLKKIKYIDWIQNETTRYYGPGIGVFPRVAQKDHLISNIQIKKGTVLAAQNTTSHFDQKLFKNPLQFRPQRWESQANISNLLGFGGGPRSCIGKHLAMLESKIALIQFVRRFKEFKLDKQTFKMCTKLIHQPQPMEMTLVPF